MTVFIFDLDGTLVDSFQQITNAANATRSEHGFAELDSKTAHELIGLPAHRLFEDLQSQRDLDHLVSDFREKLKEMILSGNTVYSGVTDFLNSIIQSGHFTAVATSKPQNLAELVIQNSELQDKVHFVQGTDFFPPKPDPTVINLVLKKFNETGIMFGDRPEDIDAATRAKIPSVGVAQSIFNSSQLLEAGASFTVNSFIELSEKLPTPAAIIQKLTEQTVEH